MNITKNDMLVKLRDTLEREMKSLEETSNSSVSLLTQIGNLDHIEFEKATTEVIRQSISINNIMQQIAAIEESEGGND